MALLDLGEIRIDPRQLARWASGQLPREWHSRYPFLFDADDLRVADKQKTVHFFEWLAAVILHHTTGFHALVEKYEFVKSHARKKRVIEQLLAPELLEPVCDGRKGAQCPDLLMFAPDLTDWFFCEVKGPTDRVRPTQQRVFDALAASSGKPIRLLRFSFLPPS